MTLRTALVIDGDARGAAAAAAQASAGLKQLDAATNAATAATRVNTAAQQANNAMTRQAVAQRTNLIFQLNDIFVSLASGQNPAMVAIQQGSQISTIYGPGGLGKALTETGKLAVSAATKFAPLAIATGVVAAGIAGLTYEINRTRKGIDVSFGDTALAVLQTFGDYIWNYIKPAVMGIADWFNDEVWPAVTSGTASAINTMVRGWMGFMAEIELISEAIKNIFKITWQDVYNGFIDNVMTPVLKSAWVDINKLLARMGQQTVEVDLSLLKVEDPRSGWATEALDKFNARKKQIAGTDYAGQFFDDVGDHAQDNATDRQKKKKKGPVSDYARELAQIRERTAALVVENNVIGLSTFAAEKMRRTLELETAARKDSIGLTPARVAEIEKEATAYARATATLEAHRAAYEALSSAGESAIDKLTDAWLEGGKNMGETIRQVLADLVKLAVQMSLINPLKNALFGGSAPTFGGIDIFSMLFGGGAKGGASSVVSLIPGLGGIGKNARGTRNWRGGWTEVGEEGPERVWLPKGSQVYSNSESKGMGGQRPVNNFYGVPSQPEERPNASGGFDYIFKEIDRRFADGRMGKGFANKYALRAPTGRP